MKEFILWDNDGVLVNTEKYFFKANMIVLSELGLNLTLENFKDISLRQGKSVLEAARGLGFDDKQILELRDRRDEIYEQYIFSENLALLGVNKTLELLSAKFRMGVVTSTKHRYFSGIHNNTGFNKYFEFVVAREDYNITKPNPEAYLLGIKKTGLTPDKIIAVEDTPRGLWAANKAGLDCIIVPNEFAGGLDFKGATKIFDKIDEIIPYLLNVV